MSPQNIDSNWRLGQNGVVPVVETKKKILLLFFLELCELPGFR